MRYHMTGLYGIFNQFFHCFIVLNVGRNELVESKKVQVLEGSNYIPVYPFKNQNNIINIVLNFDGVYENTTPFNFVYLLGRMGYMEFFINFQNVIYM